MNLGSLVAQVDGILEEYKEVSSVSPSLWMDWGSDFYHGADWQILPVFASRSWADTHYSSGHAWESIMAFLAEKWPQTLKVVFGNCDPERISLVAFSRLRANNELKPHAHDNNGHLIFHLGVEIPEGDVGIQTSDSHGVARVHEWKKTGDWILFDDTKTHNAWHWTRGDRVVFYLDFLA